MLQCVKRTIAAGGFNRSSIYWLDTSHIHPKVRIDNNDSPFKKDTSDLENFYFKKSHLAAIKIDPLYNSYSSLYLSKMGLNHEKRNRGNEKKGSTEKFQSLNFDTYWFSSLFLLRTILILIMSELIIRTFSSVALNVSKKYVLSWSTAKAPFCCREIFSCKRWNLQSFNAHMISKNAGLSKKLLVNLLLGKSDFKIVLESPGISDFSTF